MKPMELNQRAFFQDSNILGDYMSDVQKAINYLKDHAGEKIDDLDLVESEKDRIAYLESEFHSLVDKTHEILRHYDELSQSADEAIALFGGEGI